MCCSSYSKPSQLRVLAAIYVLITSRCGCDSSNKWVSPATFTPSQNHPSLGSTRAVMPIAKRSKHQTSIVAWWPAENANASLYCDVGSSTVVLAKGSVHKHSMIRGLFAMHSTVGESEYYQVQISELSFRLARVNWWISTKVRRFTMLISLIVCVVWICSLEGWGLHVAALRVSFGF